MGEAETNVETGEGPSIKQMDDSLRACMGGKKKFIIIFIEGETDLRCISNMSDTVIIDILIVAMRARFQSMFKELVGMTKSLEDEKRILMEQLKKQRLAELEDGGKAS